MREKIKKEWVKALRSGEYEQGESFLCAVWQPGEGARFCCLGVLVDTCLDGYWKQPKGVDIFWEFEGSSSRLSDSSRDKLDLSLSEQRHLIDMNDTYGNSFHEIADWIEGSL